MEHFEIQRTLATFHSINIEEIDIVDVIEYGIFVHVSYHMEGAFYAARVFPNGHVELID